MTNTHSAFLKEMGITEWTSRDAAQSTAEVSNQTNSQNSPEVLQPPTPVSNGMWWFFGSEPQGDAQILFRNMIRVLGLAKSEWSWKNPEQALSQSSIPEMPVVAIAFGGPVAQKITGERDPLPQLRETVLALNTSGEYEIPVIATFELNQVLVKPIDKALLWQDILLARSVLQNG
jgi:uracil-DNA glycosylase